MRSSQKKWISRFCFLFIMALFTVLFQSNQSVKADAASAHTQDLIIVKYGLTDGAMGFTPGQTTNDGLAINNLPIDNLGNQLAPMSGIHYLIQKVTPTDGWSDVQLNQPASYQKEGAAQDVVTGQNGRAELNLADGCYIISEQANPAKNLSKAAAPLLIKLPVEAKTTMGLLDRVYIYPKSSVDKGEEISTPPSTGPGSGSDNQYQGAGSDAQGNGSSSVSSSDSAQTKPSLPTIGGFLPDTGETRTALTLFGLALVALVGFLIYLRKKRKEEEEVN